MGSKYWDKSWNPLKVKGGGYHCTKCSPGCLNCWAEKYNLRFGNKRPYSDTGRQFWYPHEFVLDDRVLQQPLRRKKPTTYFVCDLCDLFHESVPFEFIDKVFAVGALCPQHKLLILTKRIERMAEYFRSDYRQRVGKVCARYVKKSFPDCVGYWPEPFLKNIHLGVTICTQKEADEKIPILLQIPATYRFLSIEPMLGRIDFSRVDVSAFPRGKRWINSLVIGCESGPQRRNCNIEWIREIVWQAQEVNRKCAEGGWSNRIKIFVKQIEINGKVEHNMSEFPKDLRIREPI